LIGPSTESSKLERILIVRLSAMGDVIHTHPAAQLLRDAFPNAMIGWLIEERWAELLCAPGAPKRGPRSAQRPLANWVHPVKLTGWRGSLLSLPTLTEIAKVWNDVRAARYQVAVDLQGAMRSSVLARLSGAPVIFGASQPREAPASLWYTRRVIPSGKHVIEQNISIAEAVVEWAQGGEPPPAPLVRFPRDENAEARMHRWLSESGVSEFAIVNPGAGWGAKRWPAERYGLVARELAAFGLRSVINYGPGEDGLAREAEAASEGAAKALRCSISELIALTRCAKLFVGGDTGPLHLAAALRVPVVAIFGPTDPGRNGPYGTRSIVLRNPESVTSHTRRAQPEEGMLEIGVQEVVTAAKRLLADASRGQECPRHTGDVHG
jgi:lipopolysaccharide heptosyltransferase I